MSEQYESIKNKLKKLLALAERGVQGEAENARRLLEKLCKEHGISIEELLDENQKKWYGFNIGRRKVYKDLFSQCYFMITDTSTMPYKSLSQSKIAVELTAMQYAELVSLYEWHKANFNKDLEELEKNITLAYCRKHRIFSHSESDDNDSEELSPEDIERIWKIIHLQESLNDNHYRKMIEKGGSK